MAGDRDYCALSCNSLAGSESTELAQIREQRAEDRELAGSDSREQIYGRDQKSESRELAASLMSPQ